ncbi:hypothetical protein NDU88_009136 [Pleurodeles waltl]|uniref:Uncharacterized protein n=1 Tax=Pleurodeles waltl TaxID=8319 RepID=A0AAV7PV49_PLEWA|nr:hypothetical protein NDU88_009136 [Pleurodeles waltl]
MRSENRDPILGLRPRRALRTARGRRKGPLRVLRPLTRTAASPAAWPQAAVASPVVWPGCAAAARGATESIVTIITRFPTEEGKEHIKLMDIVCHGPGGTGKGRSNPTGLLRGALACAQMGQEDT